jgi:hypothetical protein
VSEQRREAPTSSTKSLTLAELARLQSTDPVQDPKELAVDIWETDEELDEFLADLRARRNASLG